jgi:hypothetical protein
MPYVMVPVPEEHAVEIMEHIVNVVARASVEPWDTESFMKLFAETDEATRSVLSVVARGVLAGRDVVDTAVAQSIQLGVRELFGIVREVNDVAKEGGRQHLISINQVSEALPNGRIREQRLLSMSNPIAALVGMAEQAERETNPHPLRTDAG